MAGIGIRQWSESGSESFRGTYTLEVWFGASNGDTIYDNNGGINYSADFTVEPAPEPVNAALAVFTGLFLAFPLTRWTRRCFRGKGA